MDDIYEILAMQLSIEFEPINPEWLERINNMLDSLNEGRKKKEVYVPFFQLQVAPNVIIFAAENEGESRIFNALTLDGRVPDGFCANWRNLKMIIEDLKDVLE